MNKQLLRYGVLTAFVGSGLAGSALADPSIDMDRHDPAFMAGPIKVSLGGFTELAEIYRSHDEQADVGSSFYKIPYPGYGYNFAVSNATSAPNSQLYYEPEFRMSARQSRFAVLAQYGDSEDKLETYMETDFLSAGTTSNSNESNSYTLRIRHFYGDWQHDDWYMLAGQTWSLATPFSEGLAVRKQYNPLTIDAQYVVGFNWARQAQFRVVKNFGNFAALGFSLEEPQVAGVLNPTTASAGAGTVTSATGSGSGLLNSATTYSDDVAPDIIVKAAFEPGFGHYEIYSLTRFLHDRGNGASSTTQENHASTEESIGASMLLPVVPKMMDLKASGLIGHANGRYGSGQLNDAVVNPGNGALSGTQEEQALVGIESHPLKRLDLYLYGGLETQKRAYGDGGGAGANAQCDLNPVAVDSTLSTGNLTCSGIVGNERMLTFGGWWKAYRGDLGNMQLGVQGTVQENRTLADASGNVGHTSETMAFVSVRFYPYQ